MLAGMLLAGRPCAFALNPTLDFSQHAHTAWKIREGFTKGTIASVAQTRDGYRWLDRSSVTRPSEVEGPE